MREAQRKLLANSKHPSLLVCSKGKDDMNNERSVWTVKWYFPPIYCSYCLKDKTVLCIVQKLSFTNSQGIYPKCVLSQIQQHIKSHHSKEIQFNKSYYKKVFGQQSIVFTLIHHFYDSSCFPLEKKKPWKYPYHSHRVFFMIYLILLAIAI